MKIRTRAEQKILDRLTPGQVHLLALLADYAAEQHFAQLEKARQTEAKQPHKR